MVKNAKTPAKVYFGLHFCPGVAQYDNEKDKIFISEETAKKMDPTFSGKPVYTDHQDVDQEDVEKQADGYVVRSFYNKFDGKHWSEFIVTSDKGHEALRSGWRLSNCYNVKNQGGPGVWHNIDYQAEVLDGEYDHLAIVQNPRYEESIVLTPEQFKEYNIKKESELTNLTNSKKKKKGPLMFWKKEKVENSEELENSVVTLADGRELTVSQLVDDCNRKIANKKKNEEEEAEAANKKKNEEEEEENRKKNEEEEKENAKKKYNIDGKEVSFEELENCWKKANSEDEDEDDKENEDEEDEEKENKKNSKIKEIKNAIDNTGKPAIVIDTMMSKTARGKSLYGSN